MSSFCRRATDLIPFNIDAGICPAVVEITSRADIDAVLNDLEDQRFTGHLKMSSSSRTARGSLLLRRGKLLGCIYGQKTQLHPLPTEDSFRLLLNDCRAPGTQILLSTLNEEIVLPMSALFLGYPLEQEEFASLQDLQNWLLTNKKTACTAITLPSNRTLLEFVHKGTPIGTFEVETQQYTRSEPSGTQGDQLVKLAATTDMACSVLVDVAMNEAIDPGYAITNRRTLPDS